jgi:hypothetical protein
MPYQLGSAPPGLRGFLLSRANQQAESQAEMQAAQQAMGLQSLLIKQQQAAQEQAREQEFRKGIEALGPNPTQEGLAGLASRYASPSDLLRTHQSSLDRKATLEAANVNKQAQIEANLQATRDRIAGQIEAAKQRGADQRAIAEMQIAGRRDLMEVARNLRQPPAPTVTEIADPNDPNKIIKIDARTGQKIGDAPPKRETTGVAGETAGRVAMADQAILDIRGARDVLVKDGKVDRKMVAAMNLPLSAGMPFNEGAREAYSKMYNAVEAKLRIETGAAATQREVVSILNRFLPRVSDPDNVAKQKLDRLEDFMKTTLDQTKGVRPEALRSRQAPAPSTPAATRGGATVSNW